jgi:hypothetical protein
VTVTIVTTVTKGFGGIVENSAVVTAASFDPRAGNDCATDRYTLSPVGGATLASGGLGLLVRWLGLLVTILFVGGALVTGLSLRRGRR